MQFIFWGLFIIGFLAWRGPFAALLILLLAWAVRRVIRYGWWSLRPGALLETYLFCQFSALGMLAKSAGRVRESDIAAVEQFMAVLCADQQRRDLAIRAFTIGRRWQEGVRHAAVPRNFQRWRRLSGTRAAAQQAFLNALAQVILRGAEPQGSQLAALYQVAEWIGAQTSQVEDCLRANRAARQAPRTSSVDEQQAYQELGLASDASTADIKLAYRQLMRQYHPDKWAAQQVDPVERHAAEEKVRKIRAAYDELKRRRGFR